MGAQTSHSPLPNDSISWYRTPIDPQVSLQLHRVSDLQAWGLLQPCAPRLTRILQGFLQTVPWLFCLAASAFLSIFFASSERFSPTSALFACFYCTQANFLINAMHELGHGYVFRTKFLNAFFMRIVSFLGWLHPDMFFSSHLRHHRFTQNPPLDLENPPPIRISLRDFLLFSFLNVKVHSSELLPIKLLHHTPLISGCGRNHQRDCASCRLRLPNRPLGLDTGMGRGVELSPSLSASNVTPSFRLATHPNSRALEMLPRFGPVFCF